jgi:hypothetical protein
VCLAGYSILFKSRCVCAGLGHPQPMNRRRPVNDAEAGCQPP